ncbi:MAG: response regulator [Calditrichaeota bacterium]|nr:MAG: response regulator [Calditrichota bacterium]MBL1204994.1 response regulator [Calditrichota bacterium]NOG44824.1 response regulator [Calditrichota bacterium]
MKNLYNRVENLDELIRSVKLPYLAWKILFLVNKNSDAQEIAGLLETDEESVSNSMQLLIQNGLVSIEETSEGTTEETVTDLPSPEIEEATEQVIEEVEEEKPVAEEVSEPVVEEPGQDETLEELLQEEESIEEVVESEEPEELKNEPAEEPSEEELIPVIEEEELQNADEALDELLAETEQPVSEEVVEQAPEEPEILAEEPEIETKEEKIEINIPEGDEGDDISDEMEFNFNLTGDEKAEKVDEAPPAEKAPEETVDKTGFKKILVIDDSLVIRKMVEIALEEEEFSIETAVSGKEGLDVMDQTNPDLVILDMMLPDINGIEILKTIKASKGIPVIMLSGKDSPQMIETAKNEGAEEFLPKPFKDDDLVEKIKKLI